MRGVSRVRILLVGTLVVAFGLVLGPGCRDATQVTVDISLTKAAKCTETNGTAITVGVDPGGTEDRVAHEYVTAATQACDATSGEIGTLVLTPSGSGRASVIVVVSYDKSVTAASCKPPLFKGCIVARRQFSFTDHRHLTMPITIDPNCKDVPCDAFSTCRTGKCFPSDAACNGDACSEPGDPGDGGTAVDGQVVPDTGVPVDGAGVDGEATDGSGGTDGSVSFDSGTEGGVDAMTDAPLPNTRCTPPGGDGTLVCGNMSCSGATNYCCGSNADTATCSQTPCVASASRFCCGAMDCGGAACPSAVVAGNGAPGPAVGVCPSGVIVLPPPANP